MRIRLFTVCALIVDMQTDNPFSFFSKIYCINRASRTDRWEKCLIEFAKLDLDVQRFNAVEGGEKGCCLSHINVLRDAKEKRYKRVLILEDDVEFLVTDLQYYRDLFYLMEFIPWHLLYFGANVTQKLKKKNNFLYTAKGCLCAHAYAANETILPQIVSDARMGRIKVIDTYYLSRIQTRQKSFITSQFCMTQRPDYSDIQNYPVNYTDIKDKFELFTR